MPLGATVICLRGIRGSLACNPINSVVRPLRVGHSALSYNRVREHVRTLGLASVSTQQARIAAQVTRTCHARSRMLWCGHVRICGGRARQTPRLPGPFPGEFRALVERLIEPLALCMRWPRKIGQLVKVYSTV